MSQNSISDQSYVLAPKQQFAIYCCHIFEISPTYWKIIEEANRDLLSLLFLLMKKQFKEIKMESKVIKQKSVRTNNN